jgi:hypothetical protein
LERASESVDHALVSSLSRGALSVIPMHSPELPSVIGQVRCHVVELVERSGVARAVTHVRAPTRADNARCFQNEGEGPTKVVHRACATSPLTELVFETCVGGSGARQAP